MGKVSKMYSPKGLNRQLFQMDVEFLDSLVNDESSCVEIQRTQQHVALHPYHLNDFKKSVKEVVSERIGKYNTKLGGILLGFKNLRLVSDGGTIVDDSPFVHIDLEGDFFIFKPIIGNCVKGVVNKKSKDHIGCLVHKTFNVSVPSVIEGKIGSEVLIKILMTDFNGKLPYIKGELMAVLSEPDSGISSMGEDTGFLDNKGKKTRFSDSFEGLEATDQSSVKKSKKRKSDNIQEEIPKKRRKSASRDDDNSLEEMSRSFKIPESPTKKKKNKKARCDDESEGSLENTLVDFDDKSRHEVSCESSSRSKKKKSKVKDSQDENGYFGEYGNEEIGADVVPKSPTKKKKNRGGVESDAFLENTLVFSEDTSRHEVSYESSYETKEKKTKRKDKQNINEHSGEFGDDGTQNRYPSPTVSKRKNKSQSSCDVQESLNSSQWRLEEDLVQSSSVMENTSPIKTKTKKKSKHDDAESTNHSFSESIENFLGRDQESQYGAYSSDNDGAFDGMSQASIVNETPAEPKKRKKSKSDSLGKEYPDYSQEPKETRNWSQDTRSISHAANKKVNAISEVVVCPPKRALSAENVTESEGVFNRSTEGTKKAKGKKKSLEMEQDFSAVDSGSLYARNSGTPKKRKRDSSQSLEVETSPTRKGKRPKLVQTSESEDEKHRQSVIQQLLSETSRHLLKSHQHNIETSPRKPKAQSNSRRDKHATRYESDAQEQQNYESEASLPDLDLENLLTSSNVKTESSFVEMADGADRGKRRLSTSFKVPLADDSDFILPSDSDMDSMLRNTDTRKEKTQKKRRKEESMILYD